MIHYTKKSPRWGECQFLSRLKSQVSLARYYEQGLTAYKGGFTVDSMQLAKNMAISGLGVVTLPELATIKDVKNGLLVNIDVENFHVNTGYYLIYRTDSNLSPAALKFLMLLKEHRRDFMAIL